MTKIIKCEPHVEIDSRFINELPVYEKYLGKYFPDIEWCLATNDSRPGNFPFQIQPNQDLWVMLRTAFDKATAPGYKCVPQDEKSGMGMFEHSTRGSIGVLTYDTEGVLIPFTHNDINLPLQNIRRLTGIQQSCITDGFGFTKQTFVSFNQRLQKFVENKKMTAEYKLCHNEIDDYLWNNFQRHPQYKRSISFVFIDQAQDLPINENTRKFAEHFKSLLQDKFYNLHDRHDRRAVFHAMLTAGRENIDPDLIKKIRFLDQEGKIKFTNIFLEDLASLIKKQALKI